MVPCRHAVLQAVVDVVLDCRHPLQGVRVVPVRVVVRSLHVQSLLGSDVITRQHVHRLGLDPVLLAYLIQTPPKVSVLIRVRPVQVDHVVPLLFQLGTKEREGVGVLAHLVRELHHAGRGVEDVIGLTAALQARHVRIDPRSVAGQARVRRISEGADSALDTLSGAALRPVLRVLGGPSLEGDREVLELLAEVVEPLQVLLHRPRHLVGDLGRHDLLGDHGTQESFEGSVERLGPNAKSVDREGLRT